MSATGQFLLATNGQFSWPPVGSFRWPLTQNQIWLEITLLAADLLVWTQVLAFGSHPARRWEPKRLRLRLLTVAGRIIRTGRRRLLRLPRGWPWSDLIETGWTAMQTT